MRILRLPYKDPRTVARDIPGISELIFPGLVPSLVAYLNRTYCPLPGLKNITESLAKSSVNSGAMLFEIAYVLAEKKLEKLPITMELCIGEAIDRQQRFFDAVPPKNLSDSDLELVELTSQNLVQGLLFLSDGARVLKEPAIPGMGWVSSGVGDFAFAQTLVEVKCSATNFSASDYRQILLYWLLKYADVIGKNESVWENGILFNPRRNRVIKMDFLTLHSLVSNDRTLIETIELLQSIMSPIRNSDL